MLFTVVLCLSMVLTAAPLASVAQGVLDTDCTVKNPRCPQGWYDYDVNSRTNCYRFYSQKKNFKDAGDHCRDLGADLVSIHSREEAQKVACLLGPYLPVAYVRISLKTRLVLS